MLASLALFPAIDCAYGFTLGEIEPLSALGQPFRARVPFQLAEGESIDPGCIRILGSRVESDADLPVMHGAMPRIESVAGRSYLVLASAETTAEPILRLTLEVRCDKTGNITRQYLLLLDPADRFVVPAAAPSISALPQQNVAAPEINLPAAKPPIVAAASAPIPLQAPRTATTAPVPRAAANPLVANTVPQAEATRAPNPSAARPPRAPRATRDVLRLEPTIDDSGGTFGAPGCCFRLAYELSETQPVSQAERDRLRREFAERMGEDDVMPRLLSLRDQIEELKNRVMSMESERATLEAARQHEQSGRFAWLISLVLGTVALVAGIGLWMRRPRREPFAITASNLYDTGAHTPAETALAEAGKIPDSRSASATATAEVYGDASESDATMVQPYTAVAPAIAIAIASVAERTQSAQYLGAAHAEHQGEPVQPAQDSDWTQRLWAPPAQPTTAPHSDQPRAENAHPLALVPNLPDGEHQDDSALNPNALEAFTFNLDDLDENSSEPMFDLTLDATPTQGLDLSLDMPPETEADIDAPSAKQRTLQYRNAYVAERFPEIAAGSIDLDKPAEVVEGARIMYQEDQDVSRAVGLLQLAWSMNSQHLALWLCLFEIYWLEGMHAAYVDLGRRFREAFSIGHLEWPMIAKLGRELEPNNLLFRSDGLPAVEDNKPNWLNAQLDMMGHVLSREMRDQVMEYCAASTQSLKVTAEPLGT
ncbi:MAG: FimV family protein [Burkholderiales bacterium]